MYILYPSHWSNFSFWYPLADLTFNISDIRTISTAGAIILMIAYGYSVKGQDDPLVNVVEAAVHGFSECMEPGAYLVDMIPLRESSFLPVALLGKPISSFLSTTSAIRTRLVPWSGMESERQAVREAIGRHDGAPPSIRKGSDGKLMIPSNVLYSLHPIPPLPSVPTGVAGTGMGENRTVTMDEDC